MLSKKERLSRRDFQRFFTSGTRVHGAHFMVVYSPNPTFHGSVVVSKKVAKTAVFRNRLRRRIYNMLRSHTISSGVYIVVTKVGAPTLPTNELKKELTALLGGVTKSR